MIRTAIIGAAGRMGRMLIEHVLNDHQFKLTGALEYLGCPLIGQDAGLLIGKSAAEVEITDDLSKVLEKTDVIIDFSSPKSTMTIAPISAQRGIASVIGTTGLYDDQKMQLQTLADNGAKIVFAPNMSVGVNLMFALCDKVARLLGSDYDIEVVEMHHNKKKDAPSGTAVRLGEILASAVGLDYATNTRHGREGLVGARTKQEIGIHALRGGDVVGDHTVIFAAEGERFELVHKASSRDCFANGALRAAKFIVNAKPGLYDMQDVLNLK